MRTILALAEQTRRETRTATSTSSATARSIRQASSRAGRSATRRSSWRDRGFRDYYVDAGGDAQIGGTKQGEPWRVGIRNPFNRDENVKILALTDCGIATSGTAIRGQHIYDPHRPEDADPRHRQPHAWSGRTCYEADRFATAAFAMGTRGIRFIERRPGLEGYQIDRNGIATFTSGFERFVLHL